MTTEIKITALEDKSEKRLRTIYKSYEEKHDRLDEMLRTSQDFHIELIDIQRNMIIEKRRFYYHQMLKINAFIKWKFVEDCKGTLCGWNVSETDLDRIRRTHQREQKLMRIINE
jgi:hypothetical protein